MRTLRNTAASAAAVAVVLGGTVAIASPAQAASTTHCKTSTKSFNLPGKPDVRVKLTICIQRTHTSGGYRYYNAWLHKASWDGTSFFTGGKRFNDFSILMRAEHGNTSRYNCRYGTCETNELASDINGKEKGSKTYRSGASGYGNVYVKTRSKKWTADATVTYDVADDGKSSRSWALAGTAPVS